VLNKVICCKQEFSTLVRWQSYCLRLPYSEKTCRQPTSAVNNL